MLFQCFFRRKITQLVNQALRIQQTIHESVALTCLQVTSHRFKPGFRFTDHLLIARLYCCAVFPIRHIHRNGSAKHSSSSSPLVMLILPQHYRRFSSSAFLPSRFSNFCLQYIFRTTGLGFIVNPDLLFPAFYNCWISEEFCSSRHLCSHQWDVIDKDPVRSIVRLYGDFI
ncbi:hypothetical protein D3C87_1535950 [compost metagenome]